MTTQSCETEGLHEICGCYQSLINQPERCIEKLNFSYLTTNAKVEACISTAVVIRGEYFVPSD